MIVLDTNVISALMQAKPDPTVRAWLDAQPASSVWTTSVSVFEIRFGLALMPAGKKQHALEDSFEGALKQDLFGRVMQFDLAAAAEAATIGAKLHALGRDGEIRDVMIAGIVAARHATLATRNTKHFIDAGILLMNPWQSGTP